MIINDNIEVRRDIDESIAEKWMYQISSLWRVRNIVRFRWKTKILKPECVQKTQYYAQVKLKFHWKFIRRQVHRLVAWAFLWLDFEDSNMFVCHINDIRNDNRMVNLFLGTAKDNAIDARSKWRWKMHNQKLSPNDVIKIKKSLFRGTDMKYLAKKYWCSYHNIYCIKTWRSWSYIQM